MSPIHQRCLVNQLETKRLQPAKFHSLKTRVALIVEQVRYAFLKTHKVQPERPVKLALRGVGADFGMKNMPGFGPCSLALPRVVRCDGEGVKVTRRRKGGAVTFQKQMQESEELTQEKWITCKTFFGDWSQTIWTPVHSRAQVTSLGRDVWLPRASSTKLVGVSASLGPRGFLDRRSVPWWTEVRVGHEQRSRF